MRFRLALAFVPASLLAVGCGESVTVSWWEPTADVGAADTAILTDAYGRDDAVAAVADITQDQVQAHGYFRAIDRQHRVRLEVSRQGDAWLDTNEAMQANTVYLRVDVLEWTATTVEDVTVDEATGEETAVSNTYAHVLLSLTAADTNGLLLDESEVAADQERAGDVSDDEIVALLDTTAAGAVQQALATLLPTHMQESVALEDSDGDIGAILDELHDTGDLATADRKLSTFIAQHPNHAGALYDRAVIRDARAQSTNEYATALDDYDAAISLESGDTDEGRMYRTGRDGCLTRRSAARALGR